MKNDKLLPIADKLGAITTIEQLIDVIEHVLSIRELVGRDFDHAEIAAFRWIEDAANLPSFARQVSRLSERAQDRLVDQLAELENLLHPEDAEQPIDDTIEIELPSLFDMAEA